MAEIRLARVDERLIHGAVMTWVGPTGVDCLIAVDDKTAQDAFTVKIMKGCAANVRAEVFSSEKAAGLWEQGRYGNLRLMFVFGSVGMAYKTIRSLGLPVKELQIGYVKPAPDAEILIDGKNNIRITQKDFEQLKELKENGVNVYSQYTTQSAKIMFEG